MTDTPGQGEQMARVIRECQLPMTPQALADLALKADQDRRAALRSGNVKRAQELERERDNLLALA